MTNSVTPPPPLPARSVQRLTETLSLAIQRLCPSALAVALGGSQGRGRQDDQSDLDLVVLLAEGALVAGARQLGETVLPLLVERVQLAGGPTWKEGFGCRTSVLYADGFKVEIFAVTPDTVPVTERVLRWRPLWGAGHLDPLQDAIARKLSREQVIARVQFDVAYAHMSVCRHLSRGEVFAARHVLASLITIAIALRLFQLGDGYDPVASTKRIVRDGLDDDPVVREIGIASARLGGDAAQLAAALGLLQQLCAGMLGELPQPGDPAVSARRLVDAIAAAPQLWIAEPATRPLDPRENQEHDLARRAFGL